MLRSFYLAGAKATGANGNRLVSAVDIRAYLSEIGLPSSACLAVGVGNVVSENERLTATYTFCHIYTSCYYFYICKVRGAKHILRFNRDTEMFIISRVF